MKIKKSKLESIVREELARHVRTLMEGGPAVEDADKDKKSKEKEEPEAGEQGPVDPQQDPDNTSNKPKVVGGQKQPPTQELPDDEPADDKLDEPEEEEEPEDGEDPAGDISDELAGKSIQSITMEPKSKLMPGAMEIVLTFNEITDPLRILVNKSGVVKFYWRGLHNEL